MTATLLRPRRRTRVPALSIAAKHVSLRVPYVLSHFAVDDGPSWPRVELPRPGQGMSSKGFEEKQSGRGIGTRGDRGGYADVPGEVSEQALRCDASERLQPAAEIIHHAASFPSLGLRQAISPSELTRSRDAVGTDINALILQLQIQPAI